MLMTSCPNKIPMQISALCLGPYEGIRLHGKSYLPKKPDNYGKDDALHSTLAKLDDTY
jgi:hypothetical protein